MVSEMWYCRERSKSSKQRTGLGSKKMVSGRPKHQKEEKNAFMRGEEEGENSSTRSIATRPLC